MTKTVMTSVGSADVGPTCRAGRAPGKWRLPSSFWFSKSFLLLPCLVLILCSIHCRPSQGHFSPFLLHIKAEVEDGSSVSGKDEFPVRFGFDESIFPGFSWRGYAVVSDLQVRFCTAVTIDFKSSGEAGKPLFVRNCNIVFAM